MKIVLTGRVPSKKNSKRVFCRGKYPTVIPSEKHQEWHKVASVELLQFSNNALKRSKTLRMTFYPPDARKADLTNKAESVMDLLVDNGYLEDDNWFEVSGLLLMMGGIDNLNPRVEIENILLM